MNLSQTIAELLNCEFPCDTKIYRRRNNTEIWRTVSKYSKYRATHWLMNVFYYSHIKQTAFSAWPIWPRTEPRLFLQNILTHWVSRSPGPALWTRIISEKPLTPGSVFTDRGASTASHLLLRCVQNRPRRSAPGRFRGQCISKHVRVM